MYLAIAIGITGLALMCTVAVLNFYHAEPSHPLPQWLHKTVICGLGSLLCMKQDKVQNVKHQSQISIPMQLATLEDDIQAQQSDDNHPDQGMATRESSSLSTIASDIHQIVAGMQAAEKEEDMRKSWKLAARILDRFFLIIFLVAIFITAITMLVNSG